MNNLQAVSTPRAALLTTEQVGYSLLLKIRRFQDNLQLLTQAVNGFSGDYLTPMGGEGIDISSNYESGFLGYTQAQVDYLDSQLDTLNNLVSRLNEVTSTGLYSPKCESKCESPSNSYCK